MDTGPLVAIANRADRFHAVCRDLLADGRRELIVPAFCVAEAAYLLEGAAGPLAEADFLEGMRALEVLAPAGEDWQRIAELCRTYRDFPLGGTDASVVALAERLGVTTIITLDRRHFTVVRPKHCDAFELLP